MIVHSRPSTDASDLSAIRDVLHTGMIAQGELVKEFEDKVARYVGVLGGVAVASGTAALMLSLRSLDIGPNDEVIAPTYVCKNVLEAILSIGARPVLCDVGDEWAMTVETVAPKVTARTAAIILVDMFGIAVDCNAFKQFGVPVIEDCCQAFAARIGEVTVGTRGAAGILSFHATKCLSTGEGGMVITQDHELLDKMRNIRDGSSSKVGARIASPMTDIQAALGLSQLARYAEFLSLRRRIADQYFSELQGCPMQLPKSVRERSIFFRFPIRIKGAFNMFESEFEKQGVTVRRGVDTLLHRVMRLDPQDFCMAEQLYNETLSIPIYPALSPQEINTVIMVTRSVFATNDHSN